MKTSEEMTKSVADKVRIYEKKRAMIRKRITAAGVTAAVLTVCIVIGAVSSGRLDLGAKSADPAEYNYVEADEDYSSQNSKTNYGRGYSDVGAQAVKDGITKSAEEITAAFSGMKYRMIYYDIPEPFVQIVKEEEYERWYDKFDQSRGDSDEMAMKAFIQHFDISREDFDKANLKWAKIRQDVFGGSPVMDPGDYAAQEADEIYNGDIIYTFDDEKINEYYEGRPEGFYPYRNADEFEKAVEKGYVSKTSVRIDVEQMQADIISKYGGVD